MKAHYKGAARPPLFIVKSVVNEKQSKNVWLADTDELQIDFLPPVWYNGGIYQLIINP